MGTEKNVPMGAPPVPPTGPAGANPSVSGGGGVAFTPMSAASKKRIKLVGIVVGVLAVLVIAGVIGVKVANSSRTPRRRCVSSWICWRQVMRALQLRWSTRAWPMISECFDGLGDVVGSVAAGC